MPVSAKCKTAPCTHCKSVRSSGARRGTSSSERILPNGGISVRPLITKIRTEMDIPYCWTQSDRDTRAIIDDIVKDKDSMPRLSKWNDHLQDFPNRDFLGDLYSSGVIPPDAAWVNGRISAIPDARYQHTSASAIIARSIQRLNDQILTDGVIDLIPNGLPERGGFLYYTDRLARCLVFSYALGRGFRKSVEFRTLSEDPGPQQLFDIDSALEHASPERRSALKTALVYGHKIVGHRNTFVHVDRRRDIAAAGPFIDTLLLNELLHKFIYEPRYPKLQNELTAITSVLDIGCGSGFLLASLGQNLRELQRIEAVDCSAEAILCAKRNLDANRPPCTSTAAKEYLVCGEFDSCRFGNFDLVVCNPPYIPVPPGRKHSANSSIGGTTLIRQVTESVPTLVSKRGVLIMVISTLAENELLAGVRDAGLRCVVMGPPSGVRVTFDQDDVLMDHEWLKYLVNDRHLMGGQRGPYSHILKCYAIANQSSCDDSDSGLFSEVLAYQRELDEGGK